MPSTVIASSPGATIGERGRHLASGSHVADQLANGPSVAGSGEPPLVVADQRDHVTEPLGGVSQGDDVGHGRERSDRREHRDRRDRNVHTTETVMGRARPIP